MNFEFPESLKVLIYFGDRRIDNTVGAFQTLARINVLKDIWDDMYKSNIQGFTYTGFLNYFVMHNNDFREIADKVFESLFYTI